MNCTLSLIAQLAGFTPAPGMTIEIPAYYLRGRSAAEISHAKACLRRHGFKWRIVGERPSAAVFEQR